MDRGILKIGVSILRTDSIKFSFAPVTDVVFNGNEREYFFKNEISRNSVQLALAFRTLVLFFNHFCYCHDDKNSFV